MTNEDRLERLARERGAFESEREALLASHAGEFVVFKDRKVVLFDGTFQGAYEQAVDRFGIDDVFFLAEVRPKVQQPPFI